MKTLIGVVCLSIAVLAPAESIDVHVRQRVQAMRTPALELPMRSVSDGCSRGTLTTALLAITLLGGAGGVELAREIVIVLVPVNLVVEGTKRLTNRTRPDGENRRSNSAFPSSHAANAFAIAIVLARRLKKGAVFFLLGAALISFSRLYVDRHWLSDVVVGAGIGAGLAWIVSGALAARRVRPHAAPAGASNSGN